ncbi:hypothetical protein NC653_034075 [Populus alba x Populus x berolinensis]|uniref:Uncharacterized protein n=1 Tax=Populus alba x Populus x berolinensis TaxID=444605 RepID=A0AAD6LM27_9ROSI|nr:hypothetical protein NC653_034075 [Populus alba x Populus x berolinensis]
MSFSLLHKKNSHVPYRNSKLELQTYSQKLFREGSSGVELGAARSQAKRAEMLRGINGRQGGIFSKTTIAKKDDEIEQYSNLTKEHKNEYPGSDEEKSGIYYSTPNKTKRKNASKTVTVSRDRPQKGPQPAE